jgi:hypothetical protein
LRVSSPEVIPSELGIPVETVKELLKELEEQGIPDRPVVPTRGGTLGVHWDTARRG